jgi:hypothetical protein
MLIVALVSITRLLAERYDDRLFFVAILLSATDALVALVTLTCKTRGPSSHIGRSDFLRFRFAGLDKGGAQGAGHRREELVSDCREVGDGCPGRSQIVSSTEAGMNNH